MAAKGRKPNPALKRLEEALGPRLTDQPWDFEFFQAVRLLERLVEEAKPVGRFHSPGEEAARFTVAPSLDFPPAQIRALETRRRDDAGEETLPAKPPRMVISFLGLTGPLGMMPTHYTELIRERLRAGDTAMRDFLDLFNHRLASLFYRAWETYRIGVAYERGEGDRFTGYLMDLVGLGTPGLQNRLAIPDEAAVYYAGLLGQFPRSGGALECLLGEYFDAPIEVIPFSGAWRSLDPDAQTKFRPRPTDSESLGVGTVVGDEIWDQQSVVRVRFGPLPLEQYLDFLPDGTANAPLRSLLRFYCGEDLDVEVQLVLRREETPRTGLGMDDQIEPQLGWVSWMFSKPLDRDPDETILRLWED